MFLSKLIILKANKLIILRKLIILLNSKFTSFLKTVITEKVSGPAGHFCPVCARFVTKTRTLRRNEKSDFLEF